MNAERGLALAAAAAMVAALVALPVLFEEREGRHTGAIDLDPIDLDPHVILPQPDRARIPGLEQESKKAGEGTALAHRPDSRARAPAGRATKANRPNGSLVGSVRGPSERAASPDAGGPPPSADGAPESGRPPIAGGPPADDPPSPEQPPPPPEQPPQLIAAPPPAEVEVQAEDDDDEEEDDDSEAGLAPADSDAEDAAQP